MRKRIQMPVSSRTRPCHTRQVSAYDKYIALQIGLGKTYRESVKGWKSLERLADHSASIGCILKPLSFNR